MLGLILQVDPSRFRAVVYGSDRIPTLRLAEKYKECLTSKEKILKEIEVKKEYLSSLQPRLNSIMQVPEPCRRSHSEGQLLGWFGFGDVSFPLGVGEGQIRDPSRVSFFIYAAIPAELQLQELLNGPFPGEPHTVPAPCDCLGREEQERELGYFHFIQNFPSRGSCQPFPGAVRV